MASDEVAKERVAGQLIATLMGANYDQMAGTMNSLLRIAEKDRRVMAQNFAALYDALAAIPPMIRSVYIEERLVQFDFARSTARSILDKPETD
jgi:hypothetical protein